jgi:hypothetical protein
MHGGNRKEVVEDEHFKEEKLCHPIAVLSVKLLRKIRSSAPAAVRKASRYL